MFRKNKILPLLLVLNSCILIGQHQPNVIVVLADDVGLGDISHYRKIHSDNIVVTTPSIDKLANEGMIFTDAHSPAALCAPSRYAIMTGNHCYRSDSPRGVWGAYQKSPIKTNQLTLGKLMKKSGYSTAFFGKWHLGGDYYEKGEHSKIYRGQRHKPELDVDISQMVGGGPQWNGFDYSLTLPAGIQAAPYAVYENSKMMPLHKHSKIAFISQKKMNTIGVKLNKLEGLGDSHWNPHNIGSLLANKAVKFIDENANKQKPFFMFYSTQAVHLPHTPSSNLNGTKIANTTPSKHLDMVKELDVQMEMIIQSLKKNNVYNNTLIIFTSDNGGLLKPQTIKSGHRSNDIYRGGKNQAYEGGHRVPFIATWPNKIRQKTQSKAPIIGLDIMATLAAITNQTIEENQAMDSSNLLPIFLGEAIEPHPFLITQSGTGKEVMITKNGWKLIIKINSEANFSTNQKIISLFNLNSNPSEDEAFNLVGNLKYKNKVNQLLAEYNTTRKSKKRTGIR